LFKVKLVPTQINKAYGIVLYKATFSSPQPDMEASGMLHTVGKELLVPTIYRAGRAPEPFYMLRRERKVSHSSRGMNHDSLAVQLIA